MTISLEEHVARAAKALVELEPYLDAIVCYASTMGEHEPNRLAFNARAAIAAVREWEGARYEEFEAVLANPPEPNEALKALMRRGLSMRGMATAASIRESERAACEAIAREMAKKYLQLAEPMKRPTTRAYFEKAANALDHAADAIAARKGKGEGPKP